MFGFGLGFFGIRLERLKGRERLFRHISVFCLVVHIIFGCVIVAGCTSSAGQGLNIAKLKYSASDSALAASPKAVLQLEVNLGYFASCLQITTQTSQSSLTCSTNETAILISDTNNFDQSVGMNVDLFNFMVGTAKRFRIRCMDPYTLIVAVILSFAAIVCYAFTSPRGSKYMYKYAAAFSYFSFILTLASAVWLETNITTALLILNTMVDLYYSLSAERGSVDHGLMWTAVVMQLVASLCMGFLGVVGGQIEEEEKDTGIVPE